MFPLCKPVLYMLSNQHLFFCKDWATFGLFILNFPLPFFSKTEIRNILFYTNFIKKQKQIYNQSTYRLCDFVIRIPIAFTYRSLTSFFFLTEKNRPLLHATICVPHLHLNTQKYKLASRAPRCGVMVRKLVSINQLRLHSEFDPHCVPIHLALCYV